MLESWRAAAKEIALLVRRSRKKPAACTTLLLPAAAAPGILANNFLLEVTLGSGLQNTGAPASILRAVFSGKKARRAAAPRAGGLFVSVGRGLDGGRGRRVSGWAGTGPGVGPARPYWQAQPASPESGQRPVQL